MDQEINLQRMRSMSQMLLEMAGGNFTNRIQRTEEDDELEGLVVLMNMVAEEMKESVFHAGFINPHHSYRNLVQSTFILDEDFVIVSYNSEASILLNLTPDFLCNMLFKNLLSEESLCFWNRLEEEILLDPDYYASVQLIYIAQNKLLVPVYCTISRLMNCSKILISFVTTVVEETISKSVLITANSNDLPIVLSRPSDILMVQNVYDYILDHLDSPLPSVKELSYIFGTNDNKLKYGFKQLFRTTIYQFYINERLKKAHLLIQQTMIPLKSIATMAGFKTYPNFSKGFKKHFGYKPMDIKRKF
ncbi:AraC family transcriptional regulator [Flavobacterium bomense]|uniref:AraC family transcriptional regulator n=1 Tax=Flavobacterium bomense TaxID=2497483 RepID=A0A3S0MZB7_9FLAO|nr:AraC family transcriptional regulator [Flavobacterium bomense]RTZ03593.1 AraC family transcriptional regulator [Flavobacterium bomense]